MRVRRSDLCFAVLCVHSHVGHVVVDLEILGGVGATHICAPVLREHEGLTVCQIVPAVDRADRDLRRARVVCQRAFKLDALDRGAVVVKIDVRIGRALTDRLPASENRRIAGQKQSVNEVDRSLSVLVRGPLGNIIDYHGVAADSEDRAAVSSRPDRACEAVCDIVCNHAAGNADRSRGGVGTNAARDVGGVAGDLAVLHIERCAVFHEYAARAVSDRAVGVRVGADRAAAKRERAAVDRNAAAEILPGAAAGYIAAGHARGAIRAVVAFRGAVDDRKLCAASDGDDAVARRRRLDPVPVEVERMLAGGNADRARRRHVRHQLERRAARPVRERGRKLGVIRGFAAARNARGGLFDKLHFAVVVKHDRKVRVVACEILCRIGIAHILRPSVGQYADPRIIGYGNHCILAQRTVDRDEIVLRRIEFNIMLRHSVVGVAEVCVVIDLCSALNMDVCVSGNTAGMPRIISALGNRSVVANHTAIKIEIAVRIVIQRNRAAGILANVMVDHTVGDGDRRMF